MSKWKEIAKKEWGKQAEWIEGDGCFALLAWCRVLTITLWQTEQVAGKRKQIIDKFGCGGFCRRDHEIIDLNCLIDERLSQIKMDDLDEPEFPMSFVLQRIKANYIKGYEEGQEDLLLVTDSKMKELRWDLDCAHAREKEDWGTWRDKAIAIEKQLKDANKDISFWKAGCRAFEKGKDEEKHKLNLVKKENDRLNGRIEILLKELQPYRDKRMREIATNIELQYAGRARR